MRKIFLNTIQTISPENSLPLPKNGKNKSTLRTSDLNGHVYSKAKSN